MTVRGRSTPNLGDRRPTTVIEPPPVQPAAPGATVELRLADYRSAVGARCGLPAGWLRAGWVPPQA
jgi:hypothetical protein